MAFAVKFSTNHCLNSHDPLLPSVSSNPISQISPVSSLSTRDAGHHMKLKHPSRASAEGLEPAVFAALVPNSAEEPLQELIERILAAKVAPLGMLTTIDLKNDRL
ncbi:hypothetical protein NC651_025620 [Populus alba x Populus x berolinensis]|nr:hypothetical protein NC651_025620 [Populus alba x Populus x berolinensis]